MEAANDPNPEARRRSVSMVLYCIAEALAEGRWREFKFVVRQHRTERRDARTNALRSAGPARLEISFSMDVPEDEFKADYERRKGAILAALQNLSDSPVSSITLIEQGEHIEGNRPDWVILDELGDEGQP